MDKMLLVRREKNQRDMLMVHEIFSIVLLLVSILVIGWLIGALIVWVCGDPKRIYAHKKTIEALRTEQRVQDEAIEKYEQALRAEQRVQEEAIQVIRKHVERV